MATNQTYVKTEVVGSSSKSVSDAIEFRDRHGVALPA